MTSLMRWLPPALAFVAVAGIDPPASATELVPAGSASVWRYLDDGSAPPEGWTSRSFSDQRWKSGKAPLGFGERGIRTEVSAGPDPDRKIITTYFRRTFQARGASDTPELALFLRVDDGAVVYLNGSEVLRHNLPSQAGPDTRARSTTEPSWQRVPILARFVTSGRNVLAVEVHQSAPNSSDLYFDLALEASRPPPPPARVAAAAREVTEAYLRTHFLPPEVSVPDGFLDGGRGTVLTPDGLATSRREILIVDRGRDRWLARHLRHARDPQLAALAPLERAQALARYVDRVLTPPPADGPKDVEEMVELFTARFANHSVALGTVAGAGVCRHRALLFKILADEAKLPVALVRGNHGEPSNSGGHTWNELHLPGQRLIVDIMNPSPEFHFPTTNSPQAAKYLTVFDKPVYP